MPVILTRAHVHAPVEEVFAFFDDPANLGRLMPPPIGIRPLSVAPAPPQPGTVIEFRYGLGPIQRSWIVRLVERVENERIVDETLSGPMRRFHHAHTFRRSNRGTWIEDRVDYHVGPDGPVGVVVDWIAGIAMRATFVWRHLMQRRILGG